MTRKKKLKSTKPRSGKSAARRHAKASARAKKASKSSAKRAAGPRRERSTPSKPREAAPARTDSIDSLIAASAHALRLPIDPAWLSGIKFNLQLIFNHAALVDEFSLPDEAEPAPVFHA